MSFENLQRNQVAGDATAAFEPGEVSPLSLQMIRRSLYRYRVFIAVCTALGVLLGLVAALRPRHYTAVSRIEVRPGSSSQYKVDASELLSSGNDSMKLDTEVLILQSDTLLLDTARRLHLDTDPDFMGSSVNKPQPDHARAEESLLLVLHKNITADRVPRTEIMEISCNSKSALLSARVVNTLVAEYIEQLFQSRFSSTQRVTKWLSGQLDDLKQQVESDQEKLVQLQSRLGIVGLDQNHDIVVSELEDLTKAADEARIQRIIAEARYRILDTGDLDLLEGGGGILERGTPSQSQLALLANLRNQRATANARLASLSARYGAKYPEREQAAAEVATLDKEIQAEENRVLNQAHQAFSAATNNEQSTVATLEAKKSLAFQKQNDMVQYQILLHDYEASRTLYEGLMQRLRQAGIVAGLDSSEVDVVDMARVPGKPSEIRRSVTVIFGLIFGLAVGLAGALVLIQFDQRLHDLSTLESQFGLALISIIPRLERGEGGKSKRQSAGRLDHVSKVFIDSPRSPFVEAMWSLRTSLLLSTPTHAPQVIVFSSCNVGEGKSTVSSGEACALALRNARVLLIDGDMRRPSLMLRFGVSNTIGLSSILTGRAKIDEALQSVPEIPNLTILTSGPVPPSPPLILGSEAMTRLMTTLKERFDFIVIDCPPLLGMVDATVLAQFAEAVVLVLNYRKLNRAQILRARRTFQQVGRPITGVVLNFADPQSLGDYGYGYGYGEGYGAYGGENTPDGTMA